MCLLLRLLTVVSTAVLLQHSLAAVVITAPSVVTEDTAGLETREQGPTAWICSALAINSPWNAYANIRGYLEGGNEEAKDYSDMILYPVMEIFHASESRLCVYLPSVDHCFPPAPSGSQVKAVKQLNKKNYYDMRFWGPASDTRVQYYKQKLAAALDDQGKSFKDNLFFVSYFGDHVTEVRYDPAPIVESRNTESLTCAPGPDNASDLSQERLYEQVYFIMNIEKNRLNLLDVQSQLVLGKTGRTRAGCASEAADHGINAFSFVNGQCKLYTFEGDFCFCIEGSFEIYINKYRYGEAKELMRDYIVDEGLKEMIIYSEITMTTGWPSELLALVGTNIDASSCQAAVTSDNTVGGAYTVDNQCFTTKVHDIYNCNQTCRGSPAVAIVREENPSQNPPILSLCGQTDFVLVRSIGLMMVPSIYYSHSGFGCYYYQEAKTPQEEDCVVKFETATARSYVEIHPVSLNMDSNTTCRDMVNIYNVTLNSRDPDFTGCIDSWSSYSDNQYITIIFHRQQGNTDNFMNRRGFRLLVTAGYTS